MVKVKTIFVINSNAIGSIIDLPKETAKKFASEGYVEIIKQDKPKEPAKPKQSKKVSAPKKTTEETKPKETKEVKNKKE